MAENVYFGNEESNNFVIEVLATRFLVHWDVLTSSIPYFKKMKQSAMIEAHQNKAKLDDDPEQWRVLLNRIYPPSRRLSLEQAVFILPLVNYLQIDFLLEEIKEVGVEIHNSRFRTPEVADLYGKNNLAAIPVTWFAEASEWSFANAKRFVEDCNSCDVVRAAATLFVNGLHEAVTADYRSDRTVYTSVRKKYGPVYGLPIANVQHLADR